MKKLLSVLLATMLLSVTLMTSYASAATINYNNVISDASFDDSTVMNAAQIDAFLNTFPSSCISTHNGFSAPDPTSYSPSGPAATGGFTYGGNVSAGTVIYHAAQAYGISPRVILVTLQKEQGLVAGDGGNVVRPPSDPTDCGALAISASLGYNCPDSLHLTSYSGFTLYAHKGVARTSVHNTCVEHASYVGFSRQVIIAAWQLTFDRHRSEGLNNWYVNKTGWDNSDDLGFCYSGRTVKGGPFYLCPDQNSHASDPFISHSGQYVIDGKVVVIANGATASLYNYTPHLHGNLSFFNIFVSWFGNPNNACYGTANLPSTPSGRKIISYQYKASGSPYLTLSRLNNTGSTCTEAHLWNPGYTSWATHIVTGKGATNPATGTLVDGNVFGNKQDELFFLKYSGSGGAVELHQLSSDLQHFPGIYDVGTNLTGVTASSGSFVAGDFMGRGYDQLVYVMYSGGGGKAEIHMFDPKLKKAIGYYDVATDLTGVTATSGSFVAGDFLGRGYDQLVYLKYGSNSVDVHMFNKTLKNAIGFYDVVTNLNGVNATSGTFVSGDFLGRSYDQLMYVRYAGTSGRVETHTFTRDLKHGTGFQDIITNLAGFDPST